MTRAEIEAEINSLKAVLLNDVVNNIYTNTTEQITGNRLQLRLTNILNKILELMAKLNDFLLNTESDTGTYAAYNRMFEAASINTPTNDTLTGATYRGEAYTGSYNPGDLVYVTSSGTFYVFNGVDTWILFYDLGSAVASGIEYRGEFDPNSQPYPTDGATPGDFWLISAPGTFNGETVEVGDTIRQKVNTATSANDFYIQQVNVVDATDTTKGVMRFATDLEAANASDVQAALRPNQVIAPPNADETTAGLVEEATQVQTTTGTDVGETGAKLFVPPSKLNALFFQNTAGNTLFVNPLNPNASDAYTRAEALGKPDKPFSTITGALAVANTTDAIKVVSNITENFTLNKSTLLIVGKNVTISGKIILFGTCNIAGEDVKTSKIVNTVDNLFEIINNGEYYLTSLKLECPNNFLMLRTAFEGGDLYLKNVWATGLNGFLGTYYSLVSVVNSQIEVTNDVFRVAGNFTTLKIEKSYIKSNSGSITVRGSGNPPFGFIVNNSTLVALNGTALSMGTSAGPNTLKNTVTNSYIFAATGIVVSTNGNPNEYLSISKSILVCNLGVNIAFGVLTNLLLENTNFSNTDVVGSVTNRTDINSSSLQTALNNLSQEINKIYY